MHQYLAVYFRYKDSMIPHKRNCLYNYQLILVYEQHAVFMIGMPPFLRNHIRLVDSWAVLAAIAGHLLGTGGLAWLVSKVMTVGESTCACMRRRA